MTAIQLIAQMLTIIRVNGTGALPPYWMTQIIKGANSGPNPTHHTIMHPKRNLSFPQQSSAVGVLAAVGWFARMDYQLPSQFKSFT